MRRCKSDESGAVLVEFALVVPLLLTLILGIIEFGWTFGQYLDVRHGAREAGRLAAVNFKPTSATGDGQSAAIVAETCSRLSNPDQSSITITIPGGRQVGAPVTVTVTQDLDGLTGFFGGILPDDLSSTASSRLEQTATFNATDTYTSPCPA